MFPVKDDVLTVEMGVIEPRINIPDPLSMQVLESNVLSVIWIWEDCSRKRAPPLSLAELRRKLHLEQRKIEAEAIVAAPPLFSAELPLKVADVSDTYDPSDRLIALALFAAKLLFVSVHFAFCALTAIPLLL